MTTTTTPTLIRVGIGNFTEHNRALRLVVTIELTVGDRAGDLADRGFQTVDHKPVEPGTLGCSITHETINRRARKDSNGWLVSGGASVPRDEIQAIADQGGFDDGMTLERAMHLADLHDRWHLSSMKAGCAHMTPIDVGQTISFPTPSGWRNLFTVERYVPGEYTWIGPDGQPTEHRNLADKVCDSCGHKTKDGVYEKRYEGVDHYGANSGLTCPVTGYKYGSAWLVEPLPADVVADLLTYAP